MVTVASRASGEENESGWSQCERDEKVARGSSDLKKEI